MRFVKHFGGRPGEIAQDESAMNGLHLAVEQDQFAEGQAREKRWAGEVQNQVVSADVLE
jgi:hypothetical protein